MKAFAVGQAPIEREALEALVRADTDGALVAFCGIVRERADDGRAVSGLSYEAHVDMAEAEFATIADEACAQFGECSVAVHHRIGDLSVGEAAVVVAVASVHRSVAFEACRYIIDALKSRAPIWKRERYTDGTEEWRENDCGSAR